MSAIRILYVISQDRNLTWNLQTPDDRAHTPLKARQKANTMQTFILDVFEIKFTYLNLSNVNIL